MGARPPPGAQAASQGPEAPGREASTAWPHAIALAVGACRDGVGDNGAAPPARPAPCAGRPAQQKGSNVTRNVEIGIIMGSASDWPTMQHAARVLDELGVGYEAKVVSAHRTPQRLYDYARSAAGRGLKVIIAGAGGAAHLPGMTASLTSLPVLGVPIATKMLGGQDSLLSIVQMPAGIPVGTLAIGEAGAANAGLLAAQILALGDAALATRLAALRSKQTASVPEAPHADG